MSPVYQTSSFNTRKSRKRALPMMDFYAVTIEDFDGDSFDFEVMAESYEDAAKQAESLASNQGIYNILNMFIYSL